MPTLWTRTRAWPGAGVAGPATSMRFQWPGDSRESAFMRISWDQSWGVSLLREEFSFRACLIVAGVDRRLSARQDEPAPLVRQGGRRGRRDETPKRFQGERYRYRGGGPLLRRLLCRAVFSRDREVLDRPRLRDWTSVRFELPSDGVVPL